MGKLLFASIILLYVGDTVVQPVAEAVAVVANPKGSTSSAYARDRDPAAAVPAPGYPWRVWTSGSVAVPASTTGKTYYVDASAGKDGNAGTSPFAAFLTLKKAVSVIAAGDTVLIRKGLYRESLDVSHAPTGTAAEPITFGSYGDGEVIIDGSSQVNGWTRVSGSVWKAPVSFTPIAVIVDEEPLKQVRDGAPSVTAGSGRWFYNSSTRTIIADFRSTTPASADIIVPGSDGAQQHVYFYNQNYYIFRGLTIRGSGSNGIWGYGSHITVKQCNIKFNGKAAVAFLGAGDTDNAVLYSHAYQNVLLNWPRGNNDYASAGGGWPGAVSWYANYRPLARGNIVHMNGGEGILSYGTRAGKPSGSALFEENVSYDNWSTNMYFDNQPNDVARNNIIFNHPVDTSTWLQVPSDSYPWNTLYKYSVCIMLADEQGSSDATNNHANLANTQVYNNLLAGCRIGIRDYSEGTIAEKHHGLKNTLIANNTIILPPSPVPDADTMGIYLQDNTTPGGTSRDVDTRIENNLVYSSASMPLVWLAGATPSSGITLRNNLYYSPFPATAFRLGGGSPKLHSLRGVTGYLLDRLKFASNGIGGFAEWQQLGVDSSSRFADPRLLDVPALQGKAPAVYDYRNAAPGADSPALGNGVAEQQFSNNLAKQSRRSWNIGAF